MRSILGLVTACAIWGQIAPDPALLYVCVQDDAKIAVVDMAGRRVVKTIDLTTLGFPATAKPHYIVVEPDGAHWYVSLIGANRVVKFDRQDRIVGQYEMETPGMMSINCSTSGPINGSDCTRVVERTCPIEDGSTRPSWPF